SGQSQACVPNGNINVTISSGIATLDMNVTIGLLTLDSTGSLVVANGFGLNVSSSAYVGFGSSSASTLTVRDPGSTLNVSGNVLVSYSGNGVLSIAGGGQVIGSYVSVGFGAGSTGTISLSGTNSK